jgi:hypothetical protein
MAEHPQHTPRNDQYPTMADHPAHIPRKAQHSKLAHSSADGHMEAEITTAQH